MTSSRPIVPVVLAHDYLTQRGGAERVVLALARAYPDAPIFTAAYSPDTTYPAFRDLDVRAARLPRALARRHRVLLPLYPTILRQLSSRIPECDVLISSSSAWAHRLSAPYGARHICYCHSPARFLWRLDDYLMHESSALRRARPLFSAYARWARKGDREAAHRLDAILANSSRTATEIERCYGRSAQVVFPPVDTDRFHVSHEDDGYFLVISRLLAYKRVDVAIRAAEQAGVRLVIVGDGPARGQLERLASNCATFLGSVSDTAVQETLAGCTALVVPAREDFGITPLEAMATGKPVVAYAAGGALETVTPAVGVLVNDQTPGAFAAAMMYARSASWHPDSIRKRAEQFSVDRFIERIRTLVDAQHSPCECK